jgi:hypothetical protein
LIHPLYGSRWPRSGSCSQPLPAEGASLGTPVFTSGIISDSIQILSVAPAPAAGRGHRRKGDPLTFGIPIAMLLWRIDRPCLFLPLESVPCTIYSFTLSNEAGHLHHPLPHSLTCSHSPVPFLSSSWGLPFPPLCRFSLALASS